MSSLFCREILKNGFHATRSSSTTLKNVAKANNSKKVGMGSTSINWMSHNEHNDTNVRYYHCTKQREIVPLVIAAVGLVAVRYSYRAMVQMEKDWEEYELLLEEYNERNGITPTTNGTSPPITGKKRNTNRFNVGIDLGSVNVRVSQMSNKHRNPSSTTSSPEIVVNSNGQRSTPNVVHYINDTEDSDDIIVWGQLADAKSYEQASQIYYPHLLLHRNEEEHLRFSSNNHDKNATDLIIAKILTDTLQNTWNQLRTNDQNQSLHAVFTYPPSADYFEEYQKTISNYYVQAYNNEHNSINVPLDDFTMVSEPVAAILAAEHYGIIPPSTEKNPTIMVLDIGGRNTTISMVHKDTEDVFFTCTNEDIGIHGNALITEVMNICQQHFQQQNKKNKNSTPLDAMAIQRVYDAVRPALVELSKQKRVDINIPYLTMDMKTQTPQHLQIGIGQLLLEQKCIQEKKKQAKFVQFLMDVLTQSNTNPFQIQHVLVHGGTVASPMIQKIVRESFSQLAGEQFVQERVLLPNHKNTTLFQELVVLGASLFASQK